MLVILPYQQQLCSLAMSVSQHGLLDGQPTAHLTVCVFMMQLICLDRLLFADVLLFMIRLWSVVI